MTEFSILHREEKKASKYVDHFLEQIFSKKYQICRKVSSAFKLLIENVALQLQFRQKMIDDF